MESRYKCDLVRVVDADKPPHCILTGNEIGNCGDCLSVSRKFLYKKVEVNAIPGKMVRYSDPADDLKTRWAEYFSRDGKLVRIVITGGAYSEQSVT